MAISLKRSGAAFFLLALIRRESCRLGHISGEQPIAKAKIQQSTEM
jgi:hypothetical protein